jgi:hypothetical protein
MMSHHTIRKLGAVLMVCVGSAFVVPSCVLQLGTGGDAGDGGAAGQGGAGNDGGGSSAGGTGLDTIMDQANELFAEHPKEVAVGKVRSTYTALALSTSIVDSVQDPNDDSALAAAADAVDAQSIQAAIDQANTWLGNLDPSFFDTPAWTKPTYPVNCIYPPQNCSTQPFICPFLGEGHLCYLSDCDLGTCSYCPFPFPIPVRSWCAYQCFLVGDHTFAGSAIYITLRGGKILGPICIPK